MVVNRVREVAEGQGHNMKSLARQTGLAYETVRLVWKARSERIDLGTVEKLCCTLNVGIGDLFEVVCEG